MEPTITELNKKVTLTNAITVNGKELTEITLKKMILRPVMKRIVFVTEELDRVIVYEGEVAYEAHKADSEATLTAALLAKIAADNA
jgi:predicted amino acid racemase